MKNVRHDGVRGLLQAPAGAAARPQAVRPARQARVDRLRRKLPRIAHHPRSKPLGSPPVACSGSVLQHKDCVRTRPLLDQLQAFASPSTNEQVRQGDRRPAHRMRRPSRCGRSAERPVAGSKMWWYEKSAVNAVASHRRSRSSGHRASRETNASERRGCGCRGPRRPFPCFRPLPIRPHRPRPLDAVLAQHAEHPIGRKPLRYAVQRTPSRGPRRTDEPDVEDCRKSTRVRAAYASLPAADPVRTPRVQIPQRCTVTSNAPPVPAPAAALRTSETRYGSGAPGRAGVEAA